MIYINTDRRITLEEFNSSKGENRQIILDKVKEYRNKGLNAYISQTACKNWAEL